MPLYIGLYISYAPPKLNHHKLCPILQALLLTPSLITARPQSIKFVCHSLFSVAFKLFKFFQLTADGIKLSRLCVGYVSSTLA